MLQFEPENIVKIGGSKLRLSHEALRRRGILAIEHLAFAEPDGEYRRLPLPFITIVLTFGAAGLWRPEQGAWERFPDAAVRGHGGRWTIGRDAQDGGSEYLTILIDPFAFGRLCGVPARFVAGRFAALGEFPGLAARLPLRELARLGGGERLLRAAEALLPIVPGDPAPLARSGLSDRQWRHRFRAELGMGPKGWTRLNRYAALLADLHPDHADGGADAGADFYDQSHLIRDFRFFTGLTPGQYRRQKSGGDPRLFFYAL